MSYKFLDHTADILFECSAKTPEQLFQDAAFALTEVMADIHLIRPAQTHEIKLTEKDHSELLFSFLEELIFLKDTKGLLFREITVTFMKNNDSITLHANCRGDTLDHINETKTDVKAVTYHEFKLIQEKDIWKARVILDI